MEQLKYGGNMLLCGFDFKIFGVEPVFDGVVVLQDGPLHEKISYHQHTVEVTSSKVPLKFTVIDFCAKSIHLFLR